MRGIYEYPDFRNTPLEPPPPPPPPLWSSGLAPPIRADPQGFDRHSIRNRVDLAEFDRQTFNHVFSSQNGQDDYRNFERPQLDYRQYTEGRPPKELSNFDGAMATIKSYGDNLKSYGDNLTSTAFSQQKGGKGRKFQLDHTVFFVNLVMDHADRHKHAHQVASHHGEYIGGRLFPQTGSALGSWMSQATGGFAVSDETLADAVTKAAEEAIPRAMLSQGWKVHVEPLSIPEDDSYDAWLPYLKLDVRGSLFLGFRVQVVRRSRDHYTHSQGNFSDSVAHFWNEAWYTREIGFNLSLARDKLVPLIQDHLKHGAGYMRASISAKVTVATANEEIRFLEEFNIPHDVVRQIVNKAASHRGAAGLENLTQTGHFSSSMPPNRSMPPPGYSGYREENYPAQRGREDFSSRVGIGNTLHQTNISNLGYPTSSVRKLSPSRGRNHLIPW